MTDIKDRLRDAAGSAGETVRESDLPPAPRLRRRRRFPSPRLLVPLTAVATALVVVVAVVLATPELRTDVTTGGIPDFYAYTTRPVNDERGGELFVRSTRTSEVLTKLELNPRWRNTVAAAPDNRTFYVSSSKPAGCHTRIRRLVVDEAGKRVSFDDVPVSVPPHTYAINVVAGTHHLAFALGLCRSQDPGQAEDPVLSLTDLRTGATRSWLGYRENYAIFTLMQQGQFSMTADGSRILLNWQHHVESNSYPTTVGVKYQLVDTTAPERDLRKLGYLKLPSTYQGVGRCHIGAVIRPNGDTVVGALGDEDENMRADPDVPVYGVVEFSLDDRQPTRVLQQNGWRGHETQILDLDASGRYPLVKRTSAGFAWLGWIADGERHRLPGKLPRASVTLESATW